MMAAREEEVPTLPTAPVDGGAPADDGADDSMPSQGASRRGKKRSRQAAGALDEEAISASRSNALTQLVARVFTRQQTQQMARAELLEGVNAGLLEGEPPFDDEEFAAGLVVMESRNKIFIAETGEVMLVG